MVFFNNLSPPRALFVIDIFGDGSQVNYWIEAYNTCEGPQSAGGKPILENLNNLDSGERFETGKWYNVLLLWEA